MPQNSTSFSDALARGVLVFDGAMGTEIYRHHVFTNRSFDELCLSDPKLIETIHRDYCDAGADVLTTNTFGAQRPGLEKYGLADKVGDINRAGAANRPAGGRCGQPARAGGRIDRPRRRTASAERGRLRGRRGHCRTGRRALGRRSRFHHLRDAALPRGTPTVRRRHEIAVRRAFHPLLHVGRAGRIDRRRAGRAPAGPAARRHAAADRLGNQLRHRTRRPADRGRAGGPRHRLAAGRAAQRGHPQGGRQPADLFLLAGIPDRIRQAVREPGRVVRRRLLRDHAGAHPRNVPERSSPQPAADGADCRRRCRPCP